MNIPPKQGGLDKEVITAFAATEFDVTVHEADADLIIRKFDALSNAPMPPYKDLAVTDTVAGFKNFVKICLIEQGYFPAGKRSDEQEKLVQYDLHFGPSWIPTEKELEQLRQSNEREGNYGTPGPVRSKILEEVEKGTATPIDSTAARVAPNNEF